MILLIVIKRGEDKITEKIDSMLHEKRKFYPSKEFSEQAYVKSLKEYEKIYKRSIKDPEGFWAEKAEQLHWFKKWDCVFRYTEPPFVKWFEGGKLNVSYNCLDIHLSTWRRNKTAIIWQGELEEDSETYTYAELHREVCKFANVLKKYGIKKKDMVCIYMPMVPALPIAMLACTRIGTIHSIVFGGFSSKALMNRINDCGAKLLITSDGSFRRGKVIPLKEYVDEALKGCPTIKKVIIYKRTNKKINMRKGRDLWWHKEMSAEDIKEECPAEWMDAEDPLFILYTSGTTGKPKGVLHTTGGYLVYTYQTFKWIFDAKDTDTFWCTADIGWITGHSYIVYGPLANGATTVIFEGVPDYPEPDRFWKVIEKYKVTIFYTAPTAIRAIEKYGDKWPRARNLSSLRLLGSVGEPIGPETWLWYYNVIGQGRCPIVDTWWQTETGGILISPLPGAIPTKPGSATKPFPGIVASILREDGKEASVNEGGYLVIMKPWPSIERTIWNDPERYKETYFSKFPGVYLTGDGAKIDEGGYFWIMGRLDDVVNISGHRIGTAEVEAALVTHKAVAEAAIVGVAHEIKGQSLYAFVTLKRGKKKTEDLKKELMETVVKEIGPIAKPDKIQFADSLPKTRSGKIMRRILRAIAEGSKDYGDTSTLADPTVIEQLVKERVITH